MSHDFVALVSKFNRKLGLVSSKFVSRAQVDPKFCNFQSYLRAVNKLLIDMVGTDLFIHTANLSVCSESLNTPEKIGKIKNILKTNLALKSADEHLPSGRNLTLKPITQRSSKNKRAIFKTGPAESASTIQFNTSSMSKDVLNGDTMKPPTIKNLKEPRFSIPVSPKSAYAKNQNSSPTGYSPTGSHEQRTGGDLKPFASAIAKIEKVESFRPTA